jgi:hypothetical protein
MNTPKGRGTVPRPLSPHPDSLQDGRSTLRSADGAQLAVYCRRNNVGAVYDVQRERWALFVPVSPGDLVLALREMGFRWPARALTRLWLDTIAPPHDDAPDAAEAVLDDVCGAANDGRAH